MDEKNININDDAAETADSAEKMAADMTDAGAAAEAPADEAKDGGRTKKSDVKKLKSENAALLSQIEEKDAALAAADDKYLRLAAEYDNFRRRSREEKEAAYSGAVSDTVKELLPLFDNLELASKYTGADSAGDATKGVEMILASVPGILEKLGVTTFGEPGETFDPEIHNAVMHVEDENLGEGEITDVFQKGYKHGDRVIRFAMVKVAN